ncbi:uncharacterized protein [Ptychodera flava]|uniref:uncharacterized protein n=1 Tax=Ptychodera flava TaxID=63121 RepID=UPI00396A7853
MASFKTEEDIERFEKEKDVSSSLRRASNTVRNLLICAAFVAFEVAKQVITYGVKEYNAGQYPISLSTIVVLIEMVKLTTCLVIFGYQGGLKTIKFSWRFAVPSFIYGINNNLFLYALHFTPPPVWNVLIQSRVIMTALIYRFVFKRDVPPMRWLALLLLMFGISLSQVSGSSTAQVGTETSAYILLKAVFLSLISAGLSTAASIYTEYLFKNDRRPFMEQQIQLYFYGVLMTSVWALYVTRGKPLEIQGNLNMTITWLLVLTILLGGAGGLLVAAIIKNIDNIAKIYSATFAIFLTAILCSMLFPANFKLNFMFVCALFFILISSWMYERFKPKPADSATNGETPSTNTIVAVPRELNGNASMLKAELKS